MSKKLTCLLLVLTLLTSLCAALADEARITGYLSKTKTNSYVLYGSFPTAADGAKAMVLWRVLSVENDNAYLLSEYILQAHRVDPQPYPYAGWLKSELCTYLNGEFMDAVFTPDEQATLVPDPENGTITLPSIEDLRNKAYGFIDNASRQAQSTEYAKANGLFVYQGKKQYSPYWSRTPSEDHAYAHRRIMDDGKTGYICVEVENLGMRPATTVDMSKLSILSGSGTKEDPFVLSANGSSVEDLDNETEEIKEEEALPENESEDELLEDEDMPAEDDIPQDEAAAPTGPQTEASAQASNASSFDPLYPALTQDGFLPEGQSEFVYKDEAAGVWLYASETLRIEIRRQVDNSKKSRPLRWLEADIFVKENTDDFLKVYYNDQNAPKKEAEIVKIAKKNHLVFAINSDWYYYRVKRNASKKVMSVGVILRENEILYNDPAKKAGSSVPNRDILALFPDGDLQVYDFNGRTAEDLKAAGAYDVLSFGPVLLSNGEITAQTKSISARQSNNPRMGVGLVEKGHYVAIMAEGRISESKGCTLTEFAQMFLNKGCVNAYNLDGGGTATMMFMGEYVNKLGSYTADKRLQIEVLGIGQSEQVQP